MDFGIKKKRALVCASSAGIGKGIATRLLEEGCKVVIMGRDIDRLNQAMKELSGISKGKVFAVPCDLSVKEDIYALHRKSISYLEGDIEILVNNQGGPVLGDFKDVSKKDLDSAIATSLNSVFDLCKMVLPSMKENKWGRIINVLSISGKQPLPGMVLSNILRPAVLGLAKSIANEYAEFGVTVNSILPANILTNRTENILHQRVAKENISYEEALSLTAAGVPVKKMSPPEDCGSLAAFLSSERASFITGCVIPFDGGMSKSLV